jgi:hypothetical protein
LFVVRFCSLLLFVVVRCSLLFVACRPSWHHLLSYWQ